MLSPILAAVKNSDNLIYMKYTYSAMVQRSNKVRFTVRNYIRGDSSDKTKTANIPL